MINWNHQGLIGLKYTGKDTRHLDPKGNRLALKHTKSAKTWIWQARVNGIPRIITIGQFPAISLADARAKAGEINADHAGGIDVYVRHGAGKATTVVVPMLSAMSCQQAWDHYIGGLKAGTNLHGKKMNKPRTLDEKEGTWRRLFRDEIGSTIISAVTEDDLHEIIQAVRDDGFMGAANSATRYLKAFMTWAKREKRLTGLKTNPAEDLAVSAMTKRDRSLSEDEVRWLWKALDSQPKVWADAYRLALLTGQRRCEIFGLHRDEVNQTGRALNIDASRMKHSKPHIVPTGDLAWKIILGRLASTNSKYLFPSFLDGEDERPLSGFSKAQKRVREGVAALAAKEGRTVPRWTFHDLRRTFSTMANGLKDERENRLIAKDHIERAMSHLIAGVEGTYDRNDYFSEKRRAFQEWEKALLKILNKSPNKNMDAA